MRSGDPPFVLPFAADDASKDLHEVIHDHCLSICTSVARGPVRMRYNHRMSTLDTSVLDIPLCRIITKQKKAFKIHLSYGFILRNKHTGRHMYYHSSCNCCGLCLEEPSLITNREEFDAFLESIQQSRVLQWVLSQRPNSAWCATA